MPWPTYSERFLHHTAAGFWVYTVPEGTRAIVTNIDAISATAVAGANCSVAIGPVLLALHFFPAQWGTFNQVVRAVAYQGEEIALGISVNDVHCTVDGYLMRDDSGRTGPPIGAAQLPNHPRPPMPGVPAE